MQASRVRSHVAKSRSLALFLLTIGLLGCKPQMVGIGDDDQGLVDAGDPAGPDDLAAPPLPPKIPGCVGDCVVNATCSADKGPTTLSGTVSIPSGLLPVYNARVFIPTGEEIPGPPQAGAYCDRCDRTPKVFSTTTDINGKFTLRNIPAGRNMPLVIQVGKWRRVLSISEVSECSVNLLDPAETRLPRSRVEGNIPKMALSTGSADALECLLRSRKLGLDDSEFTPESGPGRVNLYAGATGAAQYVSTLNGGARFTASLAQPNPSWWDSYDNWAKYDIVMLSCEGQQYMQYKSQTALQNLEKYVGSGGRVFASHWHNGWMANAQTPQKIQTVATFANNLNLGTIAALINTNQDKGAALADWLILPSVSGAMPPPRGQLPVMGAKNTVSNLNMSIAQRWVDAPSGASQYFSFDAPIGAAPAELCGQMVFTDLHVSGGVGGDTSQAGTPFPGGCNAATLSAQEKALIFMLFDLTNCLQPPIG
ncbi:MAG TPA: carboxypeptidase-like regulatory domain-containing protein [Pseudomonadota bacterium]|nr:carboxypeptidase-like regulatory domain-containing protein [Pseudomonadota bacterium]